jgi:coenzyme F420-reducing hydrogenase beta subunit
VPDNTENCYGCRACEQICPVGCIKMVADDEGFLYPQKDNALCTECGLCIKVCPIDNDSVFQEGKQTYYCFVNADAGVVDSSSSGGAFSALANEFCKSNKCKVFGARWGNGFNVRHCSVDNPLNIEIFQKSKYLQSDVLHTYSEVKEGLEQGEKVVFSGTPCQIAGLKAFLQKEYDNLLTIDILCHGVPSYKVFKHYIEYLEDMYNSSVKEFEFRKRSSLFGVKDSCGTEVKFSNGKELSFYSFNDIYMKGFFSALYYRKSCYRCEFSQEKRVSDVTIGDFWGIEKTDKRLNAHEGVSLIISNSVKGSAVLKGLHDKHKIYQIDKSFAIPYNKNLISPTPLNKNRDEFFRRLKVERFDIIVNDYVRNVGKIKFLAAAVTPDKIKNIMRNVRERIKI